MYQLWYWVHTYTDRPYFRALSARSAIPWWNNFQKSDQMQRAGRFLHLCDISSKWKVRMVWKIIGSMNFFHSFFSEHSNMCPNRLTSDWPSYSMQKQKNYNLASLTYWQTLYCHETVNKFFRLPHFKSKKFVPHNSIENYFHFYSNLNSVHKVHFIFHSIFEFVLFHNFHLKTQRKVLFH